MTNEIVKNNKLKLSVIIATYGREEVLEVTLNKLTEQTFPKSEFEVIVVDDASADKTAQMIESMKKFLPYEVRLFSQQRRGPGGANNRGALEARADIILFLANDMHAVPKTLEAHYRSHIENPEPNVAVVGKLRESPEMPKTGFQSSWNPFLGKELDGKQELNEMDFWVSNLSMKRSFFMEHGIFNEYPGPAFEDLEFSNRLFKKGMKLIYNSEALTYHYHIQTVDSAIDRIYETGRNFYFYEDNVTDDTFYKAYKVLSNNLKPFDYARVFIAGLVRSAMFNRFTIPFIALPYIHRSETVSYMKPFVGFFSRRVLGYYLRKGIAESRKRKDTGNVR